MNINNFPKIIPKYMIDEEGLGTILEVHQSEINKDKVYLYYTNAVTELDLHEQLIKLFHELTHIFDAITFENNNQELSRYFLGTYSEYHAEKISMMKDAGFNNINDTRKINPNITMHGKEKYILVQLNSSLHNSLYYFNKNEDFWKNKNENFIAVAFRQAMLHTFYFMGRMSFYDEYCISIGLPNFILYHKYAEKIELLYKYFIEYENTQNVHIINQIESVYKQLQNDFIKDKIILSLQ